MKSFLKTYLFLIFDRLLSLTIMFSRLIHVVPCISSSFIFIAIYFMVCLYHICLSSHQLMDICIVSTIWLLVFLWTFTHKSVWVWVFFSVVYIPKSRMVGHMVTLYLTLWGNAKLFSISLTPLDIPTSKTELQILHILVNCYFPF